MSQQPVPSMLRPLGLAQVLTPPDRRLDAAPLFDVLLIAAMFFILGSRFIFAPGLSIVLPESTLPDLTGVSAVDVLTVKDRNFIIYRETKYSLATLTQAMGATDFERLPENAYLLVRADEGVDMETFIAISQLAREAGYQGVQLAAREQSARAESFEEDIPAPSLFP